MKWLAVAVVMSDPNLCFHIGPFQFQHICESAIETAVEQKDWDSDYTIKQGRCVPMDSVPRLGLPRMSEKPVRCVIDMED